MEQGVIFPGANRKAELYGFLAGKQANRGKRLYGKTAIRATHPPRSVKKTAKGVTI
jgi:hypothetical protein